MKKIGIIGAMEREVTLLRSHLENPVEKKILGVTFYEGRLGKFEVALVRCGVGKVNAAICTTLLIEHFAPECVINTGSCGGLHSGMSVFDVIVANDAVEHDLDYDEIGDPRGAIFFPDGTSEIFMPADKELSEKLLLSAKNCGCNAYSGRIASGDRFVYSEKDREEIHSWFDADGCEMEGAAVAQVCTVAGVPFAIVRCVSDGIGATKVSYYDFVEPASVISAKIIADFAGISLT